MAKWPSHKVPPFSLSVCVLVVCSHNTSFLCTHHPPLSRTARECLLHQDGLPWQCPWLCFISSAQSPKQSPSPGCWTLLVACRGSPKSGLGSIRATSRLMRGSRGPCSTTLLKRSRILPPSPLSSGSMEVSLHQNRTLTSLPLCYLTFLIRSVWHFCSGVLGFL